MSREKGTKLGHPISVLLADDHAIVREGLRLIFEGEPDIDVVGEAADLETTLRYVRGRRPDVLVLDVNLAGVSALDALPELRQLAPETAIVILTMQTEPSYARRALESGARAYVAKESAARELVEAVQRAARGETYLQPEIGARLVAGDETDPFPDDLTSREVEVLELIALGHTNAEIADKLFLSVRTVENHRARIQAKLGIAGRAELVRYAVRAGLGPGPRP